MCTLHDFSVLKSNLFIRALLLDRILVTEKTTRTPRVHLVLFIATLNQDMFIKYIFNLYLYLNFIIYMYVLLWLYATTASCFCQ